MCAAPVRHAKAARLGSHSGTNAVVFSESSQTASEQHMGQTDNAHQRRSLCGLDGSAMRDCWPADGPLWMTTSRKSHAAT
jgi:hypothetical protein